MTPSETAAWVCAGAMMLVFLGTFLCGQRRTRALQKELLLLQKSLTDSSNVLQRVIAMLERIFRS